MVNVSNAWAMASRELLMPETHIEITYTVSEPGLQEDASSSSTDKAYYSQTEEIVANEINAGDNYGTLEQGLWGLDGSFEYIENDRVGGYVSGTLSDNDGIFSSAPKIVIEFSELHTMLIPGVTITWGEAHGEWAENFRISAWADSIKMADKTVLGNKDVTSIVWMNLKDYNRLEIEILKWSHPQTRAKCAHIRLGLKTLFTKEDLLSYEHTQTADLLSASLPKNSIKFALRNETGRWNPDNPENEGKYLLDQQEIRVRYGMTLGDKIEWIQGGLFWLDEWNIPSNGLEATFTARDELTFMNAVYTGPTVGTLYEIAEAALNQADLPLLSTGADRFYISPVLKDYETDVSDGALDDMALSAVVQMVAHAGNCVLYQDREGTIRVEPWNEKYTGYMLDQNISYNHPEYNISKPLKAISVSYGEKSKALIEASVLGEIQTVDNRMIRTEADALRVGKRAKEILENRKVISGDFRADLRLDYLDAIIVTSKYAANIIGITSVSYSTTGGAFRGKYTGRVVSIDLEAETRYSGEFYLGEI